MLAIAGSYTDGVQDYMLSGKVYAAVTWSLVWALISAPFLFEWALGVYGRASPVVRGQVADLIHLIVIISRSERASGRSNSSNSDHRP